LHLLNLRGRTVYGHRLLALGGHGMHGVHRRLDVVGRILRADRLLHCLQHCPALHVRGRYRQVSAGLYDDERLAVPNLHARHDFLDRDGRILLPGMFHLRGRSVQNRRMYSLDRRNMCSLHRQHLVFSGQCAVWQRVHLVFILRGRAVHGHRVYGLDEHGVRGVQRRLDVVQLRRCAVRQLHHVRHLRGRELQGRRVYGLDEHGVHGVPREHVVQLRRCADRQLLPMLLLRGRAVRRRRLLVHC